MKEGGNSLAESRENEQKIDSQRLGCDSRRLNIKALLNAFEI